MEPFARWADVVDWQVSAALSFGAPARAMTEGGGGT